MAVTRKMSQRHNRVTNILEGIDHDIEVSGALDFLGEEGTFAVPYDLRRSIARTALFMLQEARRKPLPKPKRDPEEYRAELAARKERANQRARVKDRVKKFKDKHGRDPNKRELAMLQTMEPHAVAKVKAAERKAKKKKAKKKPAGRKDSSGGPPPPPPPAAGAQAVGGGPAIPGREIKRRGMPAGRRRPMRQPKRGVIPSEFKAHQKRKERDLEAIEKMRQARGAGTRGGVSKSFIGPLRRGQPRNVERSLGAKAGHLARLRYMDKELRDTRHDPTLGYDPEHKRARIRSRYKGLARRADAGDEAAQRKISDLVDRGMGRLKRHPSKSGYHLDADGREVHSSGRRENKKFANATTFRDSDTDALLHTDRSREGARGSADDAEFVFKGDTRKDPRNKWYRVSKEGGYAAAMASLGKSYHKSKGVRQKVISKVKSTGFVDGKGHQINLKPTGSLHNERGACVRKPGPKDAKGRPKIDPKTGKPIKGPLTAAGKAMRRANPQEFYRLCKGPHGPSGTPDRNEYMKGFDPRHDDASKQHKLHKAAREGKATEPFAKIARQNLIKPERRRVVHQKTRRVGRAAEAAAQKYAGG